MIAGRQPIFIRFPANSRQQSVTPLISLIRGIRGKENQQRRGAYTAPLTDRLAKGHSHFEKGAYYENIRLCMHYYYIHRSVDP